MKQKYTVNTYLSGGWDHVNKQRDTKQFRQEAQQIIHEANVRLAKLEKREREEPGFYSHALTATRKEKVGQKTGEFTADFSDIQKVKSEVQRALTFLDDKTSTVTGARKIADDARKRIFKKGARGQTKEKEVARWKTYNNLIKKNPWLLIKGGDLGGWITSEQLQAWAREYREDPGATSFEDFLVDKIVDYLGEEFRDKIQTGEDETDEENAEEEALFD